MTQKDNRRWPQWAYRWVHHPQRVWLRRALFQVHLWVGLGIGLYVVVISISGSAIVYRNQVMAHSHRAIAVPAYGERMTAEHLTRLVERAYPGYEVDNILDEETPGQPDVVVLERRHRRMARLFDPYTGADLGDPRPALDRALAWLTDLHDNLLGGRTGRVWNGVGACFVSLLGLTGAVVWWPGVKHWRRSAIINWRARFPRLNWDLHSATGFWFSLLVLVWGISGIYFCAPLLFAPLAGGSFLYWISQLHLGRFGWFTEALWTIFGLAPAVLAVTGALMWWNRVPRKKFRAANARPPILVSRDARSSRS